MFPAYLKNWLLQYREKQSDLHLLTLWLVPFCSPLLSIGPILHSVAEGGKERLKGEDIWLLFPLLLHLFLKVSKALSEKSNCPCRYQELSVVSGML